MRFRRVHVEGVGWSSIDISDVPIDAELPIKLEWGFLRTYTLAGEVRYMVFPSTPKGSLENDGNSLDIARNDERRRKRASAND